MFTSKIEFIMCCHKNRMLEMLMSGLALVSFTHATSSMSVRPDFFRIRTASESSVSLPGTSNAAHKDGFLVLLSGEAAASTLLITSANNGQTFQNLRITSKAGNCVTITGAANITIQNAEIGPCGGGGIEISKSSGINIFDSYIHTETLSQGCCDNNDGIYAHNGSKDILVQGNVIAYGESNVEALGVARIRVVVNFLVNPRGPKPRGQN